MKKKLFTALIPLLCLAAPFFLVARRIGETESFARPLVPLEILALAIGLCLSLSGCLRRRPHPLTLLPAAALLLAAALTLRCPMDYMAFVNSGYMVGERGALGALCAQQGHCPLFYLFVLDDHVTLYGLLCQLLLGLTGGVLAAGLFSPRQSRFDLRLSLLVLGLACAALVCDGLISWASTRIYDCNWFGAADPTSPEMLQRVHRLNLAATLATPLLALGLGLLCGRLALGRGLRIALSAVCAALVLLGTGLFVGPYYMNPFDAVPTRWLPNLSQLLSTEAEMAFSHRWMPLLFGYVLPYRALPPLLLGTLWAPSKSK